MTPREISDLRLALHKSQEEFGRIIGAAGRTVRRWESGDTEPSRAMIAAMAVLARASGLKAPKVQPRRGNKPHRAAPEARKPAPLPTPSPLFFPVLSAAKPAAALQPAAPSLTARLAAMANKAPVTNKAPSPRPAHCAYVEMGIPCRAAPMPGVRWCRDHLRRALAEGRGV